MNESASRPRLTRGAHNPKSGAYSIVGLFSQLLPLLAYIGRMLNDAMCDHSAQAARQMVHGAIQNAPICDRCQKRLYTLGTLISGSASAVADWSVKRRAQLDARLAIAAARRLVHTVEFGEPVAWAMRGGAVTTAARRAINAATALLNAPELGRLNEANTAARNCQEMDLSTCRVARKHGLVEESYVIGFVLKAASKAAEAAVAATEATWAIADTEREGQLAQATEHAGGAAIGAALDGAALLVGTGRAEAMMVVATGVCAEFARLTEDEDACEKSTSQKVTPGASWTCDCGQSPCAVYTVDAPISLGGPAEVHFPADDAEDRGYYSAAAPCSEWTTVDGTQYRCVKVDEGHVEHETENGAVWWSAREAIAAAAELADAEDADRVDAGFAYMADAPISLGGPAEPPVEGPTEEYNVVDEFAESELADVTDEAIADAATALARLEAAEKALNAIAEEHKPVEAWTRRRELGFTDAIEYRAKCCVSCRDASGQPVPSPCRTHQKLNAFWEAI